ncbi:MAG: NifB/NifX family molybdenum-iron cluster-binding protein [Desulfobacterales bacterium]
MKMALTVWENRISPVFDAARMLLVVEIENTKIISRHYEPFHPELPTRLVVRLAQLNVAVLICGAISEMPANILEANGIKLIPFITGDAGEVIDAYVKEVPFMPAFLMPGCSHKRHRHGGKGKKHGARFAHGREVMHMPKGDGTGPQGQGPGTGKGQGGRKSGKGRRGVGKNSDNRSGKGQGRGQGRGKGAGQGQNRDGF